MRKIVLWHALTLQPHDAYTYSSPLRFIVEEHKYDWVFRRIHVFQCKYVGEKKSFSLKEIISQTD